MRGREDWRKGRLVHDGLEAEALEHGKVDLERVAAAVDAGCDKLERERGNYELFLG